jgi:hypothetical protein
VTAWLTIIEQELGCFALAIVQAGAYIFKSECGLGRYLEMYRERRGTLLEEYRTQMQKIDDYERTVYTTWLMSFERLSPQAATFFKICAFLHHDGISEAIFQNAARKLVNYVPRLPATNQELDSLSVAKDFMNWFRTTEGLSQKFLITPNPPNPNIHPSSRVRPRANSVDESLGVPGQLPMKRSRGDRSREHDAERRAREERAAFSEFIRPLLFHTLSLYLLTAFKANRLPTSSTRIYICSSSPPSVV